MTIQSQTSRIAYNGDGGTIAFAVPFYFAANADLVVILQDTLGNQVTQVLGTNYNLAGATVSTGGTCTFVTAPPTGYLVTIYRDPAVTQLASYNNNDPFPAKSHETTLDKLTTIAQRVKDQVSRAIHQTEGEAAMTTALAPLATRKNKLLAFDSNGALNYVLGPTFVGNTATGVAEVDSRATAQATIFAVSVNIVQTHGAAVFGDGGGRDYIRGTIASPTPLQDGSGVYWTPAVNAASLSSIPQGRLTLTTGVARPTVDVSGATTVFYTPAVWNQCPIFDGTNMIPTTFTELSQLTTDATKSPAAVAATQVYDIFVWNDAGIIRATRGPPWASGGGSNTARGTGAGSTALNIVQGIQLNANAITNGPAANRGTYVGTVLSNGSSTIDFTFGTTAAGGGPAVLGVWNAYNQIQFNVQVGDSTASWTNASATVRQMNSSNGNRISFVSGLKMMPISIQRGYWGQTPAVAGGFNLQGFALNATAAYDKRAFVYTATANAVIAQGAICGNYPPQLGFGFIQAVESGDGTTASTINGSVQFAYFEGTLWQ